MRFPLPPRTLRLVAFAGLVTIPLACGGSSRPAPSTPRTTTGPRPLTAQQLAARDLRRVDAATGGGVDVRANPADSTVALTIRVAGDTTPRAASRLRLTADGARAWSDSLSRFVNRDIGDAQELRLRITGVVNDPEMELVRISATDVPPVRLRSLADSSTVALRPDEVRSIARLLRDRAVIVAPVSAEETATNRVYFEFEVEKPVVLGKGGCYPHYPADLRLAGVTGEVRVQYIVGPDGRVEPESFKVLSTAHAGFTQSVREALTCMRFLPAEIRGQKVRQLVQQPFSFDISRQD